MASKQASRLFVTVVVALLAISTLGHTTYSKEEGGGGGGGDEYKEVKKEAAPESKEAAASESWAGWAQEKISEGLGIKHDDHESHPNKETATEKKQQTERVRDDEEQVSTPAKEKAKEKAKEIYDKAKNKAGETAEAAKHKSKSKSHEQVKDNVAAGGGDHPEEL